MTASRIPQCPALPLEMWAHIFTFVDEVDLWVTCRQVSRTLRAEAEREFAKNRLQHMEIFIRAHACLTLSGDEQLVSGEALIKGLLHLSADGAHATYRLTSTDRGRVSMSSPLRKYICGWLRRQALANSDLHLCRRLYSDDGEGIQRRICTIQKVRIGKHISEALLIGAQIHDDKEQVSFEWKPFLNHLFGWLAHAARLQPTTTRLVGTSADKSIPIARYMGSTRPDGKRQILTLGKAYELRRLLCRTYGLEDNLDYLQQAYIERLRRAHLAAGVVFVLDDPADRILAELLTRAIREYLEDIVQEESTESLLEDFKARHGIA